MGTLFRITVFAASAAEARSACDAAFARVRELDARLSDYREDSELSYLCRAGEITASADLFRVLEQAFAIARASGGAFDPTVGPLTRLWRNSVRTGALPGAASLAAARARTGWRRVKLHRRSRRIRLTAPNMQLDLGGIAKGFAADEMLAVLEQRLGHRRGLVAASGDLAVGDPPPARPEGWRVELTGGAIHSVTRRGVSTSGPGEQSVEIGGTRYAHIVDPRTGLGLQNAGMVSVIAPTATLADALATAAVVLPPAAGGALCRQWKALCLR